MKPIITAAWFILTKGDFNLAIQDFEMAIKLQPKRVFGYVNRAAAYLQRNEWHLAIENYTKVIELNRELVMAYYSRGTAWLSLSEWEKAKTDLTIAKDKGLDITAAFHNMYRSVAVFEQKHGVQLPGDIVILLTSEVEPDDADTYNAHGIAYGEKGDFDKAIAAFTKAIELNPEFALAYNNRGAAYAEKGEIGKAINDYNEAIKLNPREARAYHNRGFAYTKQGDFERAINDYNKAIKLNPNYALIYNGRGNAYAEKGEIENAINDYNTAIEINPRFALPYYNRGNAYAEKGEIENAINDYNMAIQLQPDYIDAYNNRGLTYAEKGEIENAINDYTKAIQHNPNFALAYNNRGAVYFKKGEIENAINDYNTAIQHDPRDPIAYYNRGEARLHLREWEKAKADLIAAKDKGMDIVAAFRNDYKNVTAFEQKHQVKLPEDVVVLVRQSFRNRYPRGEKVLTSDGEVFESAETLNLLDRIRNAGTPLGEYIKEPPYFGIETVPTEVFVVDRATRDELIAVHPSSADILKPFLRGSDIKRWQVDPQDQWLIFTYRGIEINAYPAILKYLEKYKELLSKRRNEQEWYELQASLEEGEHFAQPKLVCPNLYDKQTFAVETEGLYCGYTCYVVPTDEKWLCGLLNTLPCRVVLFASI